MPAAVGAGASERSGSVPTVVMPRGSKAAADPAVRIASGQLEQSNVNPAGALADMIEMSRHYEMTIRAMNTAEETDAASTRLIRLDG